MTHTDSSEHLEANPREVSVSEPFRSSNPQQWQIKDHEGNRLQVPVRAGFVSSQHSGKRHLLMSVNLMARQGRKTEENRHKFFPFPSSLHPRSGWLREGVQASSRGSAVREPVPAPGRQSGSGVTLRGAGSATEWSSRDEAAAGAASHWGYALMAKAKAALAGTVRAKVSQRRKAKILLGRCPLTLRSRRKRRTPCGTVGKSQQQRRQQGALPAAGRRQD